MRNRKIDFAVKIRKEETDMKRAFCLAAMGLVLISMVSLSCAPAQKTIITGSNLPTLKGKWEGWVNFGLGSGPGFMCNLVITNDTPPIQGSVTFVQLPGQLAMIFPADTKSADNSVTVNFRNANISNHGTLIAQSGENLLELTYYGGEKPKIQGWFYYWATKGNFDVSKK
jgi:hypothetical protein